MTAPLVGHLAQEVLVEVLSHPDRGGEHAAPPKLAGMADDLLRVGLAVVGQTVFESAFGGKETAALLQKGGAAASVRSEYKLVATSKTSTK